MNLTGNVCNLQEENLTTLLKDSFEQMKDTPYSWVGWFNNIKMTVLSVSIYRCNIIPVKIPTGFVLKVR